jgi:peptidoglycan/LPS O-acetylase OafA/YrhL
VSATEARRVAARPQPRAMNAGAASHAAYRPDIDGLRAIAVLLVIAFHAGLGVPGGYVGVDVFFVISGYLITGIIVREVGSPEGFSLAGFWQRRIHRILPPATAMVLAVLLLAPLLLRPDDMESLAKSALAQAAMAANVRFARMPTGYFATTSELWPLLHTWSLAVEEQFYLVYPVVLALLVKRSRRAAGAFVWIIVVVSLVGSVVLTPAWPSWSFYLLPTRAWELGLGAAIAIQPLPRLAAVWSHTLCAAGAAMVAVSGFWFDLTTPFPGSAAILPCLGAALIIGVGARGPNSQRAWLGHPVLVSIGLLSYSLYLWHWPVLAFARYYYGLQLPPTVLGASLALIALTSIASYRWIEQPCRRLRTRLSVRASLACGLALSALVVILALPAWRTDGWNLGRRARIEAAIPSAPEEFVQLTRAEPWSRADGLRERMLPERPPCTAVDFVVWGDSHATALAPLVERVALERDLCGSLLQRNATVPLPGLWQPFDNQSAPTEGPDWVDMSLERIEELRPRLLIVVARWDAYLGGRSDQRVARCGEFDTAPAVARQAVAESMRRLRERLEARGIVLAIFAQPPTQSEGLERREFVRGLLTSRPPEAWGVNAADFEEQAMHFQVLLQQADCDWIAAWPDLHGEERTRIRGPGGLFYWDDDHLTIEGAEYYFGESLRQIFTDKFGAR